MANPCPALPITLTADARQVCSPANRGQNARGQGLNHHGADSGRRNSDSAFFGIYTHAGAEARIRHLEECSEQIWDGCLDEQARNNVRKVVRRMRLLAR